MIVVAPPDPGMVIMDAARRETQRARQRYGPDAELLCNLTWSQHRALWAFLESYPTRAACFAAMGWPDEDPTMRHLTFTGTRLGSVEGVVIEPWDKQGSNYGPWGAQPHRPTTSAKEQTHERAHAPD